MPDVVCAVIIRDESVLLALHAESGLWSFPGGKAEPGENEVETLIRELSEELPHFLVTDPPKYFVTITGVTPSSNRMAEVAFYLVEGAGSVQPGAEVPRTMFATFFSMIDTTEVTGKMLELLATEGRIG